MEPFLTSLALVTLILLHWTFTDISWYFRCLSEESFAMLLKNLMCLKILGRFLQLICWPNLEGYMLLHVNNVLKHSVYMKENLVFQCKIICHLWLGLSYYTHQAFISTVMENVDWLNWFLFLFCGWSFYFHHKLHYFSVTIPTCYKKLYTNSFFPCQQFLSLHS